MNKVIQELYLDYFDYNIDIYFLIVDVLKLNQQSLSDAEQFREKYKK